MMSNKNNATDPELDQLADENQAEQGDFVMDEISDPAQMQAKIEELEQQVSELKDKFMRKVAEFENFRKRSIREKMDTIKFASQDTLTALLPVLDDFDRAKKIADDDNSTEVFTEGVELVYQKLYNTLERKGLRPMESTGEKFDAELHEAVTEIPAPTEELKGAVIDTLERGYSLNDKIIRHAKVVVGK